MSNKKQRGFTAIELALVLGFLMSILIAGSILVVGVHYVIKFW